MQPHKKNKTQKRAVINDKSHLWNIFDSDIAHPQKKTPLECLYSNEGERECCDQCKSSLVFSEEGFLVCSNPQCSIIYKDIVDETAEWRFYGADDNNSSDPTRCGMPINPLLQESSYGIKVLNNVSMNYEMRKIRCYAEWYSTNHKERTRFEDFQRITAMSNNAGIPKMIIDDAMYYHKLVSESNISFRGNNRDGIIAASIYIACRVNNYPRTAKEIAHIFFLDVTSATKGCKNAQTIINEIEKDNESNEKTILGNTTPRSFIERYCSKLNMNAELTHLCAFIANKIDKDALMPENTPNSIAAGLIYFVSQMCHLNISKASIKQVSETSEVTTNKCYKKLEKIKKTLIPESILHKYSLKEEENI